MSIFGLIALVFGTLGVWLTIKQVIYCWPVSLIAVIVSVIEFYQQRLYGDTFLQLVYFFVGIYGWIYWHKKQAETFIVQKMKSAIVPKLVFITILQSVTYYYLLLYFKGDRPLLDGILTAASLTAAYMMTKKWVENWLVWVVIDGAYVLLYCLKDMWLFAVLYLLFTVMAFYGWLKWRKTI
jgi:nicotinamide mononucleotide transporter